MARLATEKREKALCAALELFWRKGWHATSTRDLERALDMRPFHGRVVEVDRSRFACLAMIQRQIGLVDQRVEGCERRALRNAACRADTDTAFSQVDRLFDCQQQVAGEVLNLVLRHR